MGEVRRFIPSDVNSDPETVAMQGTVFDKTVAALHDGRRSEIVRVTIAKTHHRLCRERRAQSRPFVRGDTRRDGHCALNSRSSFSLNTYDPPVDYF
jgi:hypothetical protein